MTAIGRRWSILGAVRGWIGFGFLLVACAPAKEDCPRGMIGCPCLEDDECNPGFECRSGVCRDDEDPTGTSGSGSSSGSTSVSSTSPTTTQPPPTTTEPTSVGPGTVGPVSTDPTVTGGGVCACGYSEAANGYRCGFDLPPVGPVGKGSPDCISLASDVACDAIEPPIDAFGCCAGGGQLAAYCAEGIIALDECVEVGPGLCEGQ